MSSVSHPLDGAAVGKQRRRLTTGIKDSLRELGIQLSLLNHQVSARLELKDVDFDCLDIVSRYGPLSPSALARRAGLHAATMTGILDRLERAGWVVRERDPADRRAVTVRALRERAGELIRLFGGMNHAMDHVCAGYTEAELAVIGDFLQRTAGAGHESAEQLAAG